MRCRNLAYPQELGLILLSAEPATIKSLRLRVELARAPAQTSPPRQEAISVLNPLELYLVIFAWTGNNVGMLDANPVHYV
ncbi:hypothetical protein GQ600_18316 [Phytophthora cactorum]|nr:hypothetical protein GQ600_18316 [Phytophthora cactorum]